MKSGFPDYGSFIQSDKTVTNLKPAETDSGGPDSGGSDLEIVFCGFRIDPSGLSCRPDYSSYFGRNISYATTLSCPSLDPQTISRSGLHMHNSGSWKGGSEGGQFFWICLTFEVGRKRTQHQNPERFRNTLIALVWVWALTSTIQQQ